MNQPRTLYLLAGGKSGRMGEDKASLPYDDDTLLEYQAERCRPLFREVVLLSGQKTYPLVDRHVFDEQSDSGPLSGILSGLRDPDEQESVAVMAVDLPLTTLETLRMLAVRELPDESDILIADATSMQSPALSSLSVEHHKMLQPLLGIYHRRIEPQLTGYLQEGHRSVKGFLERIRVSTFPVKGEEIRNINTREEYRDLLRGRD